MGFLILQNIIGFEQTALGVRACYRGAKEMGFLLLKPIISRRLVGPVGQKVIKTFTGR